MSDVQDVLEVTCFHCKSPLRVHADGKCLYQPTRWEPVVIASGWTSGCQLMLWDCPFCETANQPYDTKSNSVSINDYEITCQNCAETVHVVG